jgi:hypothetical protein
MRVWLTSFILLFGAAEVFQWTQELTLPMPIFVMGGALLAIASNYDKLANIPLHLDNQKPEPPPQVSGSDSPRVVISVSPKARSEQPISFEIRKPFKPGD